MPIHFLIRLSLSQTDDAQHLFAPVLIQPGLQPLLWKEAEDSDNYSLTAMEPSEGKKGDRHKFTEQWHLHSVFANNSDAWDFLDDGGKRTCLMANGFYLTKPEDGKDWTFVVAAKKTREALPPVVWRDEENEMEVVDQRQGRIGES